MTSSSNSVIFTCSLISSSSFQKSFWVKMYFCETKEEPSKKSVSVALARIENFPSISVFAPTFDEILCTEIFSTSNESTTIIPRRTFRSMP